MCSNCEYLHCRAHLYANSTNYLPTLIGKTLIKAFAILVALICSNSVVIVRLREFLVDVCHLCACLNCSKPLVTLRNSTESVIFTDIHTQERAARLPLISLEREEQSSNVFRFN